MNKFKCILLFIFLPNVTFAEGYSCIGMDASGQTLKVIFNVSSGTLNINGNILHLEGGDEKTIQTETYATDKGIATKALLVHKSPKDPNVTLLQVNAVTKAVITKIPLACHEPSDLVGSGFKTPSNNIFCKVETEGSLSSLRCDIMNLSKSSIPSRPKNCTDDWGQAFTVTNNSTIGKRICYSDTVMDNNLPVLQYGKDWSFKTFKCHAKQDGIKCVNNKGHGFTISKEKQNLL